MIVNTSFVIRPEGGRPKAWFVLVTDDLDGDCAALEGLRLEPVAAVGPEGALSLLVLVPDQERILCSTAALPETLVNELGPALAERELGLLWAEGTQGARERQILGFGDGRVDLSGRLAEALAALQAGRPARAGELARALRRVRPSWPRPAVLAGQAALALGELDEACRRFDEVLAMEAENVEAHVGLGRLARLRGEADAAGRHLGRALAAYPNHVPALIHMAMLAFDAGRAEAARTALARAAAVHPASPWEAVARKGAAGVGRDEEEVVGAIREASARQRRSEPIVISL